MAWRQGFVFLANGETFTTGNASTPDPQLLALGYDQLERRTLAGAKAVFSIAGRLWETFDDGRICRADPGAVVCYDETSGLRNGPWVDLIQGPDGKVFARSATSVATFDAGSGRWSIADLPDQGGVYLTYQLMLGLFRAPDGRLVTQAAHGLDILEPQGWRPFATGDGMPAGPILAARTDATGVFWLQIFGSGLVQWVGYGNWESLERVDGLSADLAWQTARTLDGSYWIATDNGLDRFARSGDSLRKIDTVPGPSFALTVSSRGDLWSSHGNAGAVVIDPATRVVSPIGVPPVDVLTPNADGSVWIGTERGLFVGRDDGEAGARVTKVASPKISILDVKPDKLGGVYYIAGDRLRHRHADGMDVPVAGAWPGGGFEPYELVFDRGGDLWIGGAGGLFRFRVTGDRLVSVQAIPAADTLTNSITALIVDSRGWLWTGSSLGVSVFDGRRWTSLDASSGLVGDDVDQGGIREDPDGSVWTATTNGVSHLLDPRRLFDVDPLRVIVSAASLASRPIDRGKVPYARGSLDVLVGIANFGRQSSVRFHYRLSGVDEAWQLSDIGVLHYPFLPPGRHDLSIVASDTLTHQSSSPTVLTLRMAWPWWRRWWFEAAVIAAAILTMTAAIQGGTRIRLRAFYARQAELERLVDERTAQLRFVAEHDKLTGLLARSEIEARLARRLADDGKSSDILVALLDVDHFKQINDSHGHLIGDHVLGWLGNVIRQFLRHGDEAARYGGEEILLVLDDQDGQAAARVLSTFNAIRTATIRSGQTELRITSSVGVAWARSGDDWESLVGRADHALYQAKREGRNRVVEGSRRVKTSN